MDRSQLKQSLDRWNGWYLRTRETLKPRGALSFAPDGFSTALTGVRRGGKTFSAVEMSLSHAPEEVLYYNFEDPLFAVPTTAQDLETLLQIAGEYRSANPKVLILDEIQNVSGWEKWVRSATDQRRFKIVVTGSSAKLLAGEFSTALTGRAITYVHWPLSFREFCLFRTLAPSTSEEGVRALHRYLEIGGFPEVVLANESEIQSRILQQYFTDILYRDVISRQEVRNRAALEMIATYYFTNSSSLHSYSAVKKAFQVSLDLVSSYSAGLADAFLIREVPRYHPNLKIQSRDPRKVYAVDCGMQRVVSRSQSEDLGKLLENTIFLELVRRAERLCYFKDNYETDFIVVEGTRPKAAIQVSADLYHPETREREIRALEESTAALKLREAFLISWNHEEIIRTPGGLKIQVIPAWKWLLGENGSLEDT